MECEGRMARDNQRRTGKLVPLKGVKGLSRVSNLPNCDSSVVYPEYMHIMLGIIRLFMGLWFETTEEPWDLKAHRDEIDDFC